MWLYEALRGRDGGEVCVCVCGSDADTNGNVNFDFDVDVGGSGCVGQAHWAHGVLGGMEASAECRMHHSTTMECKSQQDTGVMIVTCSRHVGMQD